MTDLSKVQYTYNSEGDIQYALVPFDIYVELAGEDNVYEPIRPNQGATIDDEFEKIPNEIARIMGNSNVGVLVAWRIHRGMSRVEVATKVGVSPKTITQAEVYWAVTPSLLTALAKLYGCEVTQLTL